MAWRPRNRLTARITVPQQNRYLPLKEAAGGGGNGQCGSTGGPRRSKNVGFTLNPFERAVVQSRRLGILVQIRFRLGNRCQRLALPPERPIKWRIPKC